MVMQMGAEKQFEDKVKKYLKDHGAWVLKTWSNGVQRQGIPDLLVCMNGYFIAIELKAENGHPTKLQEWNVQQIRNAGGVAFVLYPHQWNQFQNMIHLLEHDKSWRWMQLSFDERG